MANRENVAMLPESRSSLLTVSWENINEPGAYVDKETGDLYRIPQQALVPGASPIIMKESRGPTTLVQVSRNPFCTDFEARHRCAQHNIEPNF